MSSRVEKGIKNSVQIVISQVVTMLCGFVTRVVLVRTLGKEILSLNALMVELVAFLTLAELRMGVAISYNLYEPLHKNDYPRVKALMDVYKKFFRIVCVFVLVIGGIGVPFLPMLVRDKSFNMQYVQFVYILFVLKTAVAYCYSYKILLFNADQKSYISSQVNRRIKIVQTCIAVFCMVVLKNYVLCVISEIVLLMIANIINTKLVDKHYGYLVDDNVKYDKLEKKDIKGIFSNIKYLCGSAVCDRVTTSTDSISITALVGIIQAGLYSNYANFFNSINGYVSRVANVITSSIGNAMVSEDNKSCSQMTETLTFAFGLPAMLFSLAIFAEADVAVRLLYGEDYVISRTILVVASTNFYLSAVREPITRVISTSGLFKEDFKIGALGTIVNLTVSVLLGLQTGVVGVLIGTTFTHVIQLLLKSRVLYREKFMVSESHYYKLLFKMFITFCVQLMTLSVGMQIVETFNKTGDVFIIPFICNGVLTVLICLCGVALLSKQREFRVVSDKVLERVRRKRNVS